MQRTEKKHYSSSLDSGCVTQNEYPVKEEGSHSSPPAGDSAHCSLDKVDMGQNLGSTIHSEKRFEEHNLVSLDPSFLI